MGLELPPTKGLRGGQMIHHYTPILETIAGQSTFSLRTVYTRVGYRNMAPPSRVTDGGPDRGARALRRRGRITPHMRGLESLPKHLEDDIQSSPK